MRLSICLENCHCTEVDSRFLACVATPSGVPGLSISMDARVQWGSARAPSAHLGVTDDGRLALYVDAGFSPVPVVTRAGRARECPFLRPVILLDGDEVGLAGGRWRVHLHGPVEAASPDPSPSFVRVAAVVAGLALATGCAQTQEKPTLPESPGVAQRGPDTPGPVSLPAPPDDAAVEQRKKHQQPVEVRDAPPYKPVPYRGMDDPAPPPLPRLLRSR